MTVEMVRRHGRRTVQLAAAVVSVICLATAVPGGLAAGAFGKRPIQAPSVPLDVTAVPGPASGELVVSWQPPSYPGAYLNRLGVVTDYSITDYDLQGVGKTSWAACADLALTCTVVGLRPGRTYKVAVRDYNTRGKHSPFTRPFVYATATG